MDQWWEDDSHREVGQWQEQSWHTLAFLLMILPSNPSLSYLFSCSYPTSGHRRNLQLLYNLTSMHPTLADDILLSFRCPSFRSLTLTLVLLRFPIYWSHHHLLTLTKPYISFLPSLIRWIPIVTECDFTFTYTLYSLTPLSLHCSHWMKPQT